MNASDIITQLRALPPVYYSHERDAQTERLFRQHGAETLVVTVAGYRLNVLHFGETLVSIRPKAVSAGRGEVVLWPYTDKQSSFGNQGGYHFDPCPRPKVGKAVNLAFTAWQAGGGNVQAFYLALGDRGFCAICGATLTDPLSRARGIGPECIKKIGVGNAALRELKAIQAAGQDRLTKCGTAA